MIKLISSIIILFLTAILPSISHSQAAAIEPNIFEETIDLLEARHKDAYANKASPAPTASMTFLVKDGVANERLLFCFATVIVPLSPSFNIKFLNPDNFESSLVNSLMLES